MPASGFVRAQQPIIAIVFAALAAALVLFATARYGPGASLDSVTYLSVARNLAAGEGLVRYDGRAYVSWPPLYPATLSLGVRAGLDPSEAARLLHAGAFAATLALLFGILIRSCGSVPWAVLGCVLVLASPSLLHTFASVWSEAPFVALVTLAIWLAARSDPAPRTRDVILLGAVTGAALLTRFLGVALGVALIAWLLATSGSWRRRWQRALVFGLTASAGPVLWISWSWVVRGSAAGARGGGWASLDRNMGEYLTNVRDFLHMTILGDAGLALAAALLLLGPACTLWLWLRRREDTVVPAPAVISALFVLLYSLLLLGLASWTPVARLTHVRFGAPLWIPFVILFTAGTAALWRRRSSPAVRLLLTAALVLYAGVGLTATASKLQGYRTWGVHGFAKAQYHRSPLLEALRRGYSGQTVLSNRPHAVYLHTVIPADYSPRSHHYRSHVPRLGDFAALRERVEEEGSVPFAWFHHYLKGYGYYRPDEIRAQGFCVRAVGSYPDGTLFRIDLREPCSWP